MFGPPSCGKTLLACAISNHVKWLGYTTFTTRASRIINELTEVRGHSRNAFIDEICKPMAITTNLGLKDMRECKDVEATRIYGRILENCRPMTLSARDLRAESAAAVFGNGFLDILAARFRRSGKRTADVSDFCLPEHQGLVHPLARAVELDESSMVDHPVDHRGGKLVVSQDRSPFAELDVGGEHHASLLVAC